MDALERAMKQNGDDLLAQIEALGIRDYGLRGEVLSDRLAAAAREAREEGKEPGVLAALHNADTDGALLGVLAADPEKIMKGISIAADALGTGQKLLYLPEYAAELASDPAVTAAAGKYRVEVACGLVNMRERRGWAVIHLVSAADLADGMNGKIVDGIYVSVNGASLKRVPGGVRIADLIDTENGKAFFAGYQYYSVEEADMTVAEAGIANGVLRVLTGKDCIVSEVEKRLTASRGQSCGKCVFCREGLLQLQYMHKEIKEGRGKPEFIDLTKEIGGAMTFSSLCTMGEMSPLGALSAMAKFRREYDAHIRKKQCPAGVCFSAEAVYIDPKLCDGCGGCMDVCPKDCIEGKAKYIHMIDDFECDRCGNCMEACPREAVVKTSGKLPKLPDRLTKVGRFSRR